PLQQKAAPSKLLARWSADEEHDQKGRGDGQPAGRIRQVRNGATFRDVQGDDDEADRSRCEERDRVPANANAPAESLADELTEAAEPRSARDHGDGAE